MKKETKKNDQNEHKPKGSFFETLAAKVTTATGSTPAILIAFGVVVVWAATGPIFHFSETWQLVINTGTTIVTFLMVFLIQKTQNKDSLAIQLKLDELVAVNNSANNMLVDVEDMTEEEMKVLQKYYQNFTGKPTKEMMNAGKAANKSTSKDVDKTDKKQPAKSK